jgi:CRP-like cAMP-binding protein
LREIIIDPKERKTSIVITSPWLNPDQAATYLDISRREFLKIAPRLEHKQLGRSKKYHIQVLDAYQSRAAEGTADGR